MSKVAKNNTSQVQNSYLPPGFKMTEIGLLPEEWDLATIGEVADIKYGKAKPKKTGYVPVVGSGGVYGFTAEALVEYDTLVIGRKGTAGRVWLLERGCWPSDTTFYLAWKARLNYKFLHYYLQKIPLSGEHAKTTLPSLQKPDLQKYTFPSPSLPEQDRIAAVLNRIRRAIEATEKVISATKELKKSLMRHLFTYGPVPYNQADQVKLKETEIGPMPEEWDILPFSKSILKKKIRVGKLKQKQYQKLGRFPIVDQGQDYITGYFDDEDLVYKGELPVIIFGDHTRVFKFVEFPFICGADGTKVLLPNKELFDPHFLFLSFSALEIQSRGYNRHYSLLRGKFTPRPKLAEQRKISSMMEILDNKIDVQETRKAALEALFKTMLHLLMTAQVRVKDLDIDIKEVA